MRKAMILVAVLLSCTTVACAPPSGSMPASSGQGPAVAEAAGGDWARVVEAAKREGSVSIIGPAAVQTRDVLTTSFEQAYPDIHVDLNSGPAAQLIPRLLLERGADRYDVDLFISGTSTSIASLRPAGVLDSIRPYLGGPSTQDLSKWRDGELNFADNDREYVLVFSEYVKAPFYYNPTLVNPSEIRSYRDLLDPRWKGKMAMYDPRLTGAGQGVALYWYTTPALGKDFIRQMVGQDIAFSRDERQVLNWVAQGERPIALGVGDSQAIDMMRRGVPIKAMESQNIAEGSYLTSGTGSVSVVNRAPHPNATRVYLDFLLSQRGQLEWSQAVGFVSDRVDVPQDHVESFLIPVPGMKYDRQQNEPFVMVRDELDDFLKVAIP
jgi:iron(III) transport system substrate-binding protein